MRGPVKKRHGGSSMVRRKVLTGDKREYQEPPGGDGNCQGSRSREDGQTGGSGLQVMTVLLRREEAGGGPAREPAWGSDLWGLA